MARWYAAAALLALTNCGGANYIILEVRSQLRIPAQTDMLRITVFTPDDPSPLISQEIHLEADKPFPVDVLLEASDKTPATLRETVEALLGTTVVQQVTVEHQWKKKQTSCAPVDLDNGDYPSACSN